MKVRFWRRPPDNRSLADILSTPAARMGYEQELSRGRLQVELDKLFPDEVSVELVKELKLPFLLLTDPDKLTVRQLSRIATSRGKRVLINFVDLPEVDMLAGLHDDDEDEEASGP